MPLDHQQQANLHAIEPLREVYRAMQIARILDETEARLAQQGEAHFYIPGAGHEAIAALGPHLRPEDWLHCHYRDKALALYRGVQPVSFLHALLSKAASNSGGRRMPGFPSQRSLNIMSTPTLVGNSALQAVGVASVIKPQAAAPIVLCAVGDGSTQQGEYLEAIGEAVRAELPVLFLVEDNHYALSTPTARQTFYSMPGGEPESFYGLPIHRFPGLDAVALHNQLGEVVAGMRHDRLPRIVVVQVERLASHTNADDHTVYRAANEIATMRTSGDPLVHTRQALLAAGATAAELEAIDAAAETAVEAALAEARAATEPEPCLDAKRPLPPDLTDRDKAYGGTPENASLRMLEAMRETLRHHLETNPTVCLLGEDIADPKGDVFRLTQGLSTAFPGRVRNTALSESTIVGTAIGRAMAGETPVAFMQFADFLPLAFNQLISELGSLYWRTAGDWEAPVIIMAICGGYRPGLGPFHAQSPESLIAHIPGIDVYEPATAADAAGMLNAAFAARRPAVFFYPKSLLNDRDRQTSPDVDRHWVPIGSARRVRAGSDLTLVCWGSTLPIGEQVAAALAEADLSTDLIDLRCLFPWDEELVTASARNSGRLLVIHEDNRCCGLGAEIVATVAESLGDQVRTARVTRPDTYVPYHYGNQLAVLPSMKSVLEKAAHLLDLDLEWQESATAQHGQLIVNAIGSSPSDESVTINELAVSVGDAIQTGDLIAAVEADKAAMEITSPANGTVAEVHAAEGDVLRVGTPLITLAVADAAQGQTNRAESIPRLTRRTHTSAPARAGRRDAATSREVERLYLSTPMVKLGGRRLTNEEMLAASPSNWTSDDVVQRTGIEERWWLGEGESVVTLACDVTRRLLDHEKLHINDLSAIICSTGTPPSMTPSLACRVLQILGEERGPGEVMAYDVNAACTGYLYALQQAHDLILAQGGGRVLVLTAETLSRTLNPDDPVTRFLFGDAATATLVSSEAAAGRSRITRPILSARGEPARVLYVPFMDQSDDWLSMEGKYVFRVAVRKMVDILGQACAAREWPLDALDLIVPHQANERIIDAIRKLLRVPPERVFSHMRRYGNTSSNSIPLALSEVLPARQAPTRIGLCAFGGGFTYGAALLETDNADD